MAYSDRISGHTKLVGLIGSPVSHSLSPLMHNASFAQMGVDAVYLAFDVAENSLARVVPALTDLGVLGYNITMPDKMAILPYLDELSDAARLMGAVNTVKVADGKTTGYNTDGAGFMHNLAVHGFKCAGKRMIIAGAGGASSAIFVQAALEGMAAVDVFNRVNARYEEAQRRAADVSAHTGCEVRLHDLDDRRLLEEALGEADVVVNATRVGMKPLDDQSIFDVEAIAPHAYVADTVYNPRETRLITEARTHGNKVVPGLGMLLWQGAIAEKIWLGRDMDIDYIEKLLFS